MFIRRYSDIALLPTFKERYDYLRIGGIVGQETFGSKRYLNQEFYHSYEWKSAKQSVIIRDNGCDLGIEGRDIHDRIIIHHMNPISLKDVLNHDPKIYDPEYLICVSYRTHQAIHYGDESLLAHDYVERKPGDTCPWK